MTETEFGPERATACATARPESEPDAEYLAPRSEIERLVADICAEALGRDRVGVHDDFFLLGGQSVQVIQVVNRVRSLTGLELDLRAFFAMPTVAGLSDHVIEQFADAEAAAAGGQGGMEA